MKIVGVIPARYRSSRFPGKPLSLICGHPMIWWVYQQARKTPSLDQVLVATDSEAIGDECGRLHIPVVMTSDSHPTGTDRLGEVAARIDADFFVNIQGDEPMIEPAVIQAVIDHKLAHPETEIINTMTPLREGQDVHAMSIVKAAATENGDLLYLSRAPIPAAKNGQPVRYMRHLGLYGLSRQALLFFASAGRGPLERTEDVEMLRFLENGYRIKILQVDTDSLSVDLPEDVAKVEAAMRLSGMADGQRRENV